MRTAEKIRLRVGFLIKRLRHEPRPATIAALRTFQDRIDRHPLRGQLPMIVRRDLRSAIAEALREVRPTAIGGEGFGGIKISRRSSAPLRRVV